ncbi:MAG: DUF1016 domain-containing protein, partial [Deltaproteobacteria bacterium]|nr:DUF1016 domain-containing protein [Deltaproteobacteria bacterium]
MKKKTPQRYDRFVQELNGLLEAARRETARSVNAVLTATYWETGRRIVEYEQGGTVRAGYGAGLLQRLSEDLTGRFGRGFSVDNLELMRAFYQAYPKRTISESLTRKSGALPAASQNSESLTRNSGGDGRLRKRNIH